MADKLLSVQILRKVVGELAQDDGYSQGRVEAFFRALDGIPAAIDTDRLQEQSDMLQAYLDTGYTPGQVRDMAFLYREKCQEVARLRNELRELEAVITKGGRPGNGKRIDYGRMESGEEEKESPDDSNAKASLRSEGKAGRIEGTGICGEIR